MPVTINGYLIDAFLTETHKRSADVTSYPVESGGQVTDNIRIKPVQVTVEGIVSDTPLGNALTTRNTAQAPSDESATGATLDFLPSDEALAVLEGIFLTRELVTLVTGLKSYDNMVLFDLEIPRDAETGHALRFTAQFQQVVLVTNRRTTIRVAARLAGTQIATKKPAAPAIPDSSDIDESGRKSAIHWDQSQNSWVYNSNNQPISAADFNANSLSGATTSNGGPTTSTYNPATNTWTSPNGESFTNSPGTTGLNADGTPWYSDNKPTTTPQYTDDQILNALGGATTGPGTDVSSAFPGH